MYRVLARRYGWTFKEIAEMTQRQQLEALRVDETDEFTFRNKAEYDAWLTTQNSR